jgi:hypothetical protein
MLKNTLLYGGIILLTIVGVIAGFKYFYRDQAVHYHAGFQIYVDDKLQDFSDYKYMSVVPCTDDQHKEAVESKVHLHDGVGNIVHVHAPGVVWGDLLKYLKFTVDPKKPVEAYVNEKKVNNIMTTPIYPYDSLVLIIGNHKDISQYLKKALNKKYILDKETSSGICKG